MPSFKATALAASLLSLASAAPVEKRHPKHGHSSAGFKISQVSNPSFSGKHGPAHYARAANKYGFSVKLNAGIDPTTVTADPFGSGDAIQEYLCPVTIGGNEYQLDLDTGSSDLWVAGSMLTGTASNIYTPTSPPIPGASWSIQYGDGSTASGDVFSDTVKIGSATVTGQAVERAMTAGDSFFQGGNDGLLGLAFSSDNTVTGLSSPALTWFDNAVQQGLPAVFAADLSASGPGSYDIGQVDSAYTQLAYAEVDSARGLWMFTPDSGETGIVDTGTTLILISDEGTDAYYANTGATFDAQQGGYTFDCSTTLPDFSITVADYKATVPGSAINFAPAGDGKCFGGIQSNQGIGFAIYGDVFLKTQYVVFDQRDGAPKLGFAAKVAGAKDDAGVAVLQTGNGS